MTSSNCSSLVVDPIELQKMSALKQLLIEKLINPRYLTLRNDIAKHSARAIQEFLIKEAKKVQSGLGADQAWSHFKFLSQFDMHVDDSRKMLEQMIVSTGGGNSHTSIEFLNYTTMYIASRLSDCWHLIPPVFDLPMESCSFDVEKEVVRLKAQTKAVRKRNYSKRR